MKYFSVLMTALLCLMPALAGADEILLKNGSRMTGTITAVDARHVKIQTAYGVLDVPRSDIRSAVIGAVPTPPSGAAAAPRAADGLVAAYALDGNVRDSSGSGLDGTIKGQPAWTADRFGKAKSALAFKGNAAERIEIPNRPELNFRQMTISVWVTGDNPRLWARILQKYHYTAKKGYALLYNHKEQTIAFDGWGTDGKSFWVQTRHKLAKGWQHVCVTYDGVVLRMYYNGKMETESRLTRTFRHTSGPLTIGGGNDGNMDFPWSGKIDDVRIYSRAMSPEQVAALHQERADNHAAADLTRKDSI